MLGATIASFVSRLGHVAAPRQLANLTSSDKPVQNGLQFSKFIAGHLEATAQLAHL